MPFTWDHTNSKPIYRDGFGRPATRPGKSTYGLDALIPHDSLTALPKAAYCNSHYPPRGCPDQWRNGGQRRSWLNGT